MLAKESAEIAADELISQQRALKRQAAEARAGRASFLYFSKSLIKLPPAERVKTIQLAQRTVRRRKVVIAASIAWVAICLLVWFMVWPAAPKSVAVLALFGGLLMWLGRILLVRLEIRRMIAAHHPLV